MGGLGRGVVRRECGGEVIGLGDDIMASGHALRMFGGAPVVIGRGPERPVHSPMFENIPWINGPNPVHFLMSHTGRRNYIEYGKGRNGQQVVKQDHRPAPGVLEFTEDEVGQAAALMGIDAGYMDDKVFEVAKKAVLRELERRKWQKALEGLKAQLIGGDRVWLMNNFPKAEFEINFRKKTVTIYFEGKPVVEDVD